MLRKMRMECIGLLLVASLFWWLIFAFSGNGQPSSYSPRGEGRGRLFWWSSEHQEIHEPRTLQSIESVNDMTELVSQHYQDVTKSTLSDPKKKVMEREHHDNANLEETTKDDHLGLFSRTFPYSQHVEALRPSSNDQNQQQYPPSRNGERLQGRGHERRVQQITHGPRKCNGIKKIVQCKSGIAEDICKQELIDNGVIIVSDMKETLFFAICVNTQEEIDLVSKLTRVESVEDDPPRTLARIPGSQRIRATTRNLQEKTQITPYGVDLVRATEFWGHYGSRGAGVKVCVIDSGLRVTHEDLEGVGVSGSDDEEHFLPWDDTGFFHGTHVTGTIAAQDNDVGVVGVAPEVSIYEVRVVDDNGFTTASDLVESMRACYEAGADIINMSLVGLVSSNAERYYIQRLRSLGVMVVASSGNYGQYGHYLVYPAAYQDVISVGAVDDRKRIATFSTYNTYVDLVAPGVEIMSLGIKSDQSYLLEDGTSMAAPHVAGVAALLWSQFPSATVDQIRSALTASAQDLGACGKDRHYGYGMVDAMAAAAYLENNTITSPEIANCVEVEVNVTTDIWGNETFFAVSSQGRNKKLVYRDGPYESFLIATYTSTFLLPDGCYDLLLFDIMGDGTNCVSTGRFTVTYDGVEQINYNDFTGVVETLTFGNCD